MMAHLVQPLNMPPSLWALTTLCGMSYADISRATGVSREQFSRTPLTRPTEAACVKLLRDCAAILREPAELDPMLRSFNQARARLFDVITGDHGRKLRR